MNSARTYDSEAVQKVLSAKREVEKIPDEAMYSSSASSCSDNEHNEHNTDHEDDAWGGGTVGEGDVGEGDASGDDASEDEAIGHDASEDDASEDDSSNDGANENDANEDDAGDDGAVREDAVEDDAVRAGGDSDGDEDSGDEDSEDEDRGDEDSEDEDSGDEDSRDEDSAGGCSAISDDKRNEGGESLGDGGDGGDGGSGGSGSESSGDEGSCDEDSACENSCDEAAGDGIIKDEHGGNISNDIRGSSSREEDKESDQIESDAESEVEKNTVNDNNGNSSLLSSGMDDTALGGTYVRGDTQARDQVMHDQDCNSNDEGMNVETNVVSSANSGTNCAVHTIPNSKLSDAPPDEQPERPFNQLAAHGGTEAALLAAPVLAIGELEVRPEETGGFAPPLPIVDKMKKKKKQAVEPIENSSTDCTNTTTAQHGILEYQLTVLKAQDLRWTQKMRQASHLCRFHLTQRGFLSVLIQFCAR